MRAGCAGSPPAGEVAGAERDFLFVNAAEAHAPRTRTRTRGPGDAYAAGAQRIALEDVDLPGKRCQTAVA